VLGGPRDIVPLRPYPEQIVAAVEGSAGLILLHSSHANDSEFVHRELELAVSAGISIHPVALDRDPPVKRLALFLSNVQRLDASRVQIGDFVPSIVSAISNEAVPPTDERHVQGTNRLNGRIVLGLIPPPASAPSLSSIRWEATREPRGRNPCRVLPLGRLGSTRC